MLKDTKSLGNNKAPACESRGFVHKKRGVHFDTPPFRLNGISGYFEQTFSFNQTELLFIPNKSSFSIKQNLCSLQTKAPFHRHRYSPYIRALNSLM